MPKEDREAAGVDDLNYARREAWKLGNTRKQLSPI
jgi:hypothetical protein